MSLGLLGRQYGQGKQVTNGATGLSWSAVVAVSSLHFDGRFCADKGRRGRIVKVGRRLRSSLMLRAPPSECGRQILRRYVGAARRITRAMKLVRVPTFRGGTA